MKVGIDARFAVRKPRRGIGTYSVNLLNAISMLDEQIEFILYTDRDDVDGVLPVSANISVRRLWPLSYPLWEQLVLPLAARMDRLDLLHTLGNTAPLLLPKRTMLVLSLMDVMFLQSGEFVPKPRTLYQKLGRIYRALVAPPNARRASSIITISDYSRQDILKLINGLSPQSVVTMHLACDPRFAVTELSPFKGSKRPFFLCLGAEDPRKNTLRIVQGYLSALKNFEIEQDLVISGYENWENSPAHLLVKAASAESRVKFLSFVSTGELIELYSNATCFLYISLYEGFGIPILEAFACGCPVVASNVTSIPEVGGDAAIYVDPRSVAEIEQAIVTLSGNGTLRSDLTMRGLKRVERFNWDKVARETLFVYQGVLRSVDGGGT